MNQELQFGGVLQTYKPGSVSFPQGKNGDHLSSPTTSDEAGRSPPKAERRYHRSQAANPGTGRAPMSPYLALLQVGFSRRRVTANGRTLLPSDFTLILPLLERRYVSVPLSVPDPRRTSDRDLGVTQHPAQKSPDFPPSFQNGRTAVTRSALPSNWHNSIGTK